MKASDLLVKCLENEGIEYIIGVPGEENADFMMSLEQSQRIRFILTRHEQGAAFMAEVYGRLTGNPAGCLGTLGPGATNQTDFWLHGGSLHIGHLVLNYLVPYCVALLQCRPYPLAGPGRFAGQGRAVLTGRGYSRLPARVGSLSVRVSSFR
jgi:hypothetical protein